MNSPGDCRLNRIRVTIRHLSRKYTYQQRKYCIQIQMWILLKLCIDLEQMKLYLSLFLFFSLSTVSHNIGMFTISIMWLSKCLHPFKPAGCRQEKYGFLLLNCPLLLCLEIILVILPLWGREDSVLLCKSPVFQKKTSELYTKGYSCNAGGTCLQTCK